MLERSAISHQGLYFQAQKGYEGGAEPVEEKEEQGHVHDCGQYIDEEGNDGNQNDWIELDRHDHPEKYVREQNDGNG